MKKMKYICKASLLALVTLGLWSCKYDPYETDIPKVPESMAVKASASAIALDEENLQKDIITFDWSDARPMSDDYVISYTTKLDVVGNNFGSTTVIQTAEDDGVYTKSFTSEQLNMWANKLWKIPVNKKFTLEFRVVAEWKGGPTFEVPEVKTVTVEVTPIKVIIFDADKLSLGGDAIAAETELDKTAENVSQYAWVGDLTIGDLQIPVELDGQTFYICPADGDATLKDGQPVTVEMRETPGGWSVPAAGKYRVVINMQTKKVTIYSAATDLKPLSVTFRPSGAPANPEVTIEVAELWAYGGGTGWGAKKLGCTRSLADPQILIYSGAALAGDMKFCIAQSFSVGGVDYNQNNSYCYTCPLTGEGKRQNVSLEANTESELHGGADGETRNSYYKIPSKTTLIIFDLRNGTIKAVVKAE